MCQSKGERAPRWRWPVLAVAYLLAAAIPLMVGVVRPGMTGFKPALVQDMVYGRAWTPYVKRQLVPLMVRAGVTITPESFDAWLRDAFGRSPLVRRLDWPPAHAPEFALALGVMYVSMVGFLVVLRRLLLACLEMSPGAAHGVVLLVAVGLPGCWAGQLYIYDYTQMLLFTAALLCMYGRRWRLYYPVLVLACISKETSILLPAVFACWMGPGCWNRPR